MSSLRIWFWQLIISPHMADLAVALARRGCSVTYVAQQAMSEDRAQQGWSAPNLPGVALQWADSDEAVHRLVQSAPADSIHVCQGVRANGRVGLAQRVLAARGLRQWVVMETVNDAGWMGVLKRLVYARLFRARRATLQGVLATGHRTADWVVARGMPAARVYPFAYFLPENKALLVDQRRSGPFRFVFSGQLISRKRLDWLIQALAELTDQAFELWIVGSGPEEPALRELAEGKLGVRVRWLGLLPLSEVPDVMAQTDCLVLPSVHDGWGAVVSEALMTGTPVVCSDACGAAGVVRASGAGGVFAVDDRAALAQLLANQLTRGLVTDEARHQLAVWATCLGATAGAGYLLEILEHKAIDLSIRPIAPWLAEEHCCAEQVHTGTKLGYNISNQPLML